MCYKCSNITYKIIMLTKLKLQVDFYNKCTIDDDGILNEEYSVWFRVLEKDDRFEANCDVGNTLLHNGTGTFSVKSAWDEPDGAILCDCILLPCNDRIGVKHKKTFKDDMERYHFLKKLYVALDEWANYWWGFAYDSNSSLSVDDDIWTISCPSIYNGSMDSLMGETELF